MELSKLCQDDCHQSGRYWGALDVKDPLSMQANA